MTNDALFDVVNGQLKPEDSDASSSQDTTRSSEASDIADTQSVSSVTSSNQSIIPYATIDFRTTSWGDICLAISGAPKIAAANRSHILKYFLTKRLSNTQSQIDIRRARREAIRAEALEAERLIQENVHPLVAKTKKQISARKRESIPPIEQALQWYAYERIVDLTDAISDYMTENTIESFKMTNDLAISDAQKRVLNTLSFSNSDEALFCETILKLEEHLMVATPQAQRGAAFETLLKNTAHNILTTDAIQRIYRISRSYQIQRTIDIQIALEQARRTMQSNETSIRQDRANVDRTKAELEVINETIMRHTAELNEKKGVRNNILEEIASKRLNITRLRMINKLIDALRQTYAEKKITKLKPLLTNLAHAPEDKTHQKSVKKALLPGNYFFLIRWFVRLFEFLIRPKVSNHMRNNMASFYDHFIVTLQQPSQENVDLLLKKPHGVPAYINSFTETKRTTFLNIPTNPTLEQQLTETNRDIKSHEEALAKEHAQKQKALTHLQNLTEAIEACEAENTALSDEITTLSQEESSLASSCPPTLAPTLAPTVA